VTINWKKRAPPLQPPRLHEAHTEEDALRIRSLINDFKRQLVAAHPDSSLSRFTSHFMHDECDLCGAASVVVVKDQVLWTNQAYCEKHLIDELVFRRPG
jgi:hypothetical protein